MVNNNFTEDGEDDYLVIRDIGPISENELIFSGGKWIGAEFTYGRIIKNGQLNHIKYLRYNKNGYVTHLYLFVKTETDDDDHSEDIFVSLQLLRGLNNKILFEPQQVNHNLID